MLGAATAAAAVGPLAPGFGKGRRLGVAIGEGPALGGLAQDPGGGLIVAYAC